MNGGGLAGRRILLTRAREDCTAWAKRLQALGAAPVVFPCIECRFIDTPRLRARLAAELARAPRWLAFTSRRGVAAFATLGGGARLPAAAGVAAVGPATAAAARAALGRVDLVSPGGTAASLADILEPMLEPDGRTLLAVAENASRALQRRLGAPPPRACVRLEVYRTAPAAPPAPGDAPKTAVSALGADAVFLASPSAVAGFVNRVEPETGAAPAVFTIGPATTRAARGAGLAVAGEAPRPSLQGLLEAMRCAT